MVRLTPGEVEKLLTLRTLPLRLPEGGVVSYSRNLFIPLSNACRNACAYCGFRSEEPYIMTEGEVLKLLRAGAELGCIEALFTLGERPEEVPEIDTALSRMGYASTTEYLYHLCHLALEHNLLPHTNAGVVSYSELKALGEVNASMGLMLESASRRLCEPGMPHEHSPGKSPRHRLRLIRDAGRLRIPFTTGLLIGIGETLEEIARSLLALRKLQDRYGHLQELIIQNFKPKPGTPMQHHPEPPLELMLRTVHAASVLFPSEGIQVPPNLNPEYELFLRHGANDLGGISPLTRDHINPEAPWPEEEALIARVEALGLKAVLRLPIYPEYVRRGWYSERVGEVIQRYATQHGFARARA